MESGKLKILVFFVGVLGVSAYFGFDTTETKPESEEVQTVTPTSENPFVTLSNNPNVKSRSVKRNRQLAAPTEKLRTFEDEMLKRSPQDDGRARRLAAKNKYFDKLRDQLKEIRKDSPQPVAVSPAKNTASGLAQSPTAEPNEQLDFQDETEDFLGFPEDELIDDLPPEEYYEDF